MHDKWQIDQGARCGCRGTDEYCGCQNVQAGDRTKFNGTPEQLINALREAERRGGMMGAICGAAADKIQRLPVVAKNATTRARMK